MSLETAAGGLPDEEKPWRVNISRGLKKLGYRSYDTEAEAIAEAETRSASLGVLGFIYNVAPRPPAE